MRTILYTARFAIMWYPHIWWYKICKRWRETRIYFFVTRHRTDPYYECPSCGVLPGHVHKSACYLPELTHIPALSQWTGEWPGLQLREDK